MDVISKDIAQIEVEKWLDHKKIGSKKRELQKDNIDTLIDAIAEGALVLKDDCTLVHTLKFPTDGELSIKVLEYKPRIKMETIQVHLQGVKAADADGRVNAYIAALTSKPKDLIKKLDTEDYSICQSVAIFFL